MLHSVIIYSIINIATHVLDMFSVVNAMTNVVIMFCIVSDYNCTFCYISSVLIVRISSSTDKFCLRSYDLMP